MRPSHRTGAGLSAMPFGKGRKHLVDFGNSALGPGRLPRGRTTATLAVYSATAATDRWLQVQARIQL